MKERMLTKYGEVRVNKDGFLQAMLLNDDEEELRKAGFMRNWQRRNLGGIIAHHLGGKDAWEQLANSSSRLPVLQDLLDKHGMKIMHLEHQPHSKGESTVTWVGPKSDKRTRKQLREEFRRLSIRPQWRSTYLARYPEWTPFKNPVGKDDDLFDTISDKDVWSDQWL